MLIKQTVFIDFAIDWVTSKPLDSLKVFQITGKHDLLPWLCSPDSYSCSHADKQILYWLLKSFHKCCKEKVKIAILKYIITLNASQNKESNEIFTWKSFKYKAKLSSMKNSPKETVYFISHSEQTICDQFCHICIYHHLPTAGTAVGLFSQDYSCFK